MRDYGRVGPTFWTRGTGKALRGKPDPQRVALYLMSAPNANMIGLYYVPISQIAHEIGCDPSAVTASLSLLEGDDEAIQGYSEGPSEPLGSPLWRGFAGYSEASETVFVRTMARRQLGLEDGECLSPKDKRVPAIIRLMRECGDSRLLQAFWAIYRESFHLPDPWWKEAPPKPLPIEVEAPPKPGSGSGSGSSAGTGSEGVQGGRDDSDDESEEPVPSKGSDLPVESLNVDEMKAFQAIVGDESLRPIVRYPATLARDLVAAGPGVDVPFQIGKAGRWLRVNPKRKKKNGARFLLNWISDQQERGVRPIARQQSLLGQQPQGSTPIKTGQVFNVGGSHG